MGRRKGNFLTQEEMQEIMNYTKEMAIKRLGLIKTKGLTEGGAPIYRWVDHMGQIYFYEFEKRYTI